MVRILAILMQYQDSSYHQGSSNICRLKHRSPRKEGRPITKGRSSRQLLRSDEFVVTLGTRVHCQWDGVSTFGEPKGRNQYVEPTLGIKMLFHGKQAYTITDCRESVGTKKLNRCH